MLKWWALQVDGGVPLSSLVRNVLEELADEIIETYDVTNNTCGVTPDELRSRMYRKLRFTDRQGRTRYPKDAHVDF